jgi:prepilin-type N-terminal cleavage/methylation domain-containing protein
VRDNRGFTLVELLLVAAIVGIILSMSIASYRYARIRGGEAAAVAALTAINQAQYSYMHTCGNQRFAPHLTSLGKANPGTAAPYLSPDLTSANEVVKSGYLIKMAGTEVEVPTETCTGETPVTSYQSTADPVTPGASGLRFFGTNGDLVVYEHLETLSGRMPETGPPSLGQEAKGAVR